jgi:hypothetical protein
MPAFVFLILFKNRSAGFKNAIPKTFAGEKYYRLFLI